MQSQIFSLWIISSANASSATDFIVMLALICTEQANFERVALEKVSKQKVG